MAGLDKRGGLKERFQFKKIIIIAVMICCLGIFTACEDKQTDPISSTQVGSQPVFESSEIPKEEVAKVKKVPIKLVAYPDFSKIYGQDMLTDTEKLVFNAYSKLYGELTLDKTYEFPPVKLEDLTIVDQIFRRNYEPLYRSSIDFGYGIENRYPKDSDGTTGITGVKFVKGLNFERFEKANKRAEEILTSLVCEDTDYSKCLAISQFLCDNVTYDTDYYTEKGEDPESHLYSRPLIEGIAVCEGYAKAFNFLAHKAGIQSINVSGMAGSGAHMWNMVCVEGDWYNIDTTWMDLGIDKEYNDSYFMASDEQLVDHREAEYVYLPLYDTRPPILPKAVSAKYNPKVCKTVDPQSFKQ